MDRFGRAPEQQGCAEAGREEHREPHRKRKLRFVFVITQAQVAEFGDKDSDQEYEDDGKTADV